MTSTTPVFENTHKQPAILEKSLLHDGSGLRLNIPTPYMRDAQVGQFVQLGSSTYQLTWMEQQEGCSHFKCDWNPEYGGLGVESLQRLDLRRCRDVTGPEFDDYAVLHDPQTPVPTPDSLVWTRHGVRILRQVLVRNRNYYHVSLQSLSEVYEFNYGGYVHRFEVPDTEDYGRLWGPTGETLLRIPQVAVDEVPRGGELLNWFGTKYMVLSHRFVPERPSRAAGWELYCLRIGRNADD